MGAAHPESRAVSSMREQAVKPTWRGSVTIFTVGHEATHWQGTVKATTPAEAAERAVRLALSGQPRRAEAAFEVSATLQKEISA